MMGIITSTYANNSTTVFMMKWLNFIEELLISPLSYIEMVGAFILGGVIGAVVTYFLTADDSDEMKKKLKRGGQLMLRELGQLAEEGKERIEEEVEVVEKEAKKEIKELEKKGPSSLRRVFLRAGKKLT